MIIGIYLIFLSFLSSPSLFLTRFPSLTGFYNQVKEIRGIVGVISFFWGFYEVFLLLQHFHLLGLILPIVLISLGFLLGFQWITVNLFSNSYHAKEKANRYYYKLLPFEGSLGITAIIMGILRIIKSF